MKVPAAVKNLKLCQAFKGHNPNIINFIEQINDKEFYIEDDEIGKYTKRVNLVTSGKLCKICNPQQKVAILLPIDNKFIKNCPGGIADAAVFTEQEFHFIEFKTNAEGNSGKSLVSTYEKAMGQLKNTLNLFESNMNAVGIDFQTKVNVECNIIVSESFPRNNAMEMTYALAFAQQTKGVPLNFENEIDLK